MVGQSIRNVETGLRDIVTALRQDPHALETAYLSVIAFAGKAKTLVPLTEVAAFYPPSLPIGGGTALGEALNHLVKEMRQGLVKTTSDQKGDWQPIVFLMTDGNPTDKYEAAVKLWESKYRRRCNMVAITFGENVDTDILKRLTEHVFVFNNNTAESYTAFFKWITNSVKAQSKSVEMGSTNPFSMGDYGDLDLQKVNGQPRKYSEADVAVAVFHGRCQKTSNEYLIKYNHEIKGQDMGGITFRVAGYTLEGAFPVDARTYKEMSGLFYTDEKVSTGELTSFPTCPCCGNQFGFTVCKCGKIMCSHGTGMNTCPWCRTQGYYTFGSGNMDITRGLG